MIVRKVKPGVMQIIDTESINEIESYTLLDVSDKDAFRLLSASKDFKSEDGIVTINYNNGDSVDSMFKAIASKHSQDTSRNFVDVSKKYYINKDVDIKGTSVLIRDVKKHTIRVARRTTTNSTEGNINRLFITNYERDMFFKDVNNSITYRDTSKFMLDSALDKERYTVWSNYMNSRYLEIIKAVK